MILSLKVACANNNERATCSGEAGAIMSEKLSVLLCEDMVQYAKKFEREESKYFNVTLCDDIRSILDKLRDLDNNGKLPDLLLLDLFFRRGDIADDEGFQHKRQDIDADVKAICALIDDTGKKARDILGAYGIEYLKKIREDYPAYKLPILLYSRLGPYILTSAESSDADTCNAEFLLKCLDYNEQHLKIERFYSKWRAQGDPIQVEISRKLSTLPPYLSKTVAPHLRMGQFSSAIREGAIALNHFLKAKFKFRRDGGELRKHMKQELRDYGRRRAGEEDREFANRVDAVCNMYYAIYVLVRNVYMHHTKTNRWCDADMCLSSYSLVWREIEELKP